MVSALKIDSLTVKHGALTVLQDISLDVHSGSLLAIIGPNGAGKTTLIKSIVDLMEPSAGTISIFGAPFRLHRHKVAYVPQRMSVDWDFPISVYDVVMMGRYGKLGWLKRPSTQDADKVLESLDQVGLLAHKDSSIGSLSGGQQQRVFFARALAQQAELYLLDEPFVNIDLVTEHALVCVLQTMVQSGKTVIVVHHDIYTVRHYFDRALLLNVRTIAHGPVADVITVAHLRSAYGERYVPPVASYAHTEIQI